MLLAAALAAAAALRLLLTAPLRRLVRQVSAVATGDHTTPIEPVGPREVASIAHAAEQMRAGLLRNSAELVAAQDQLSVAVERDRLVLDLQQGTTTQLSLLAVNLSGLAARHPTARAELLAQVGETDRVLRSLRQSIFDLDARTSGLAESPGRGLTSADSTDRHRLRDAAPGGRGRAAGGPGHG